MSATNSRRWMAALCALTLMVLCGCRTINLSDNEPSFLRNDFETDTPLSLAILPPTDASDHPELLPFLREALYGSISLLPYEDRELNAVDSDLSRIGALHGVSPSNLPDYLKANSCLADCVVFTELTRISRLNLLVYSHIRIEIQLAMIDTRSRKRIYCNRFVIHDRSGQPFLSLEGLAGSLFMSFWHLRSEEMREAIEEGSLLISRELPTPRAGASSGDLRILSLETAIPGPLLCAGQTVEVRAEATSGCLATFSLGKLARDIPMTETRPGAYSGSYRIEPGDQATWLVADVVLTSPGGERQIGGAISETPFEVDGVAPPAGCIKSWRYAGEDGGVILELGASATTGGAPAETPWEWQILRRKIGWGDFRNVGRTESPEFQDKTARRGRTYEYKILTADKAGNIAEPADISRVRLTPAAASGD